MKRIFGKSEKLSKEFGSRTHLLAPDATDDNLGSPDREEPSLSSWVSVSDDGQDMSSLSSSNTSQHSSTGSKKNKGSKTTWYVGDTEVHSNSGSSRTSLSDQDLDARSLGASDISQHSSTKSINSKSSSDSGYAQGEKKKKRVGSIVKKFNNAVASLVRGSKNKATPSVKDTGHEYESVELSSYSPPKPSRGDFITEQNPQITKGFAPSWVFNPEAALQQSAISPTQDTTGHAPLSNPGSTTFKGAESEALYAVPTSIPVNSSTPPDSPRTRSTQKAQSTTAESEPLYAVPTSITAYSSTPPASPKTRSTQKAQSTTAVGTQAGDSISAKDQTTEGLKNQLGKATGARPKQKSVTQDRLRSLGLSEKNLPASINERKEQLFQSVRSSVNTAKASETVHPTPKTAKAALGSHAAQKVSLSTFQPLKEENFQKVTQEKIAAKGSASPVEKESPKPAKLSPSLGTAQKASLDTSQALIRENTQKVMAQLLGKIARRNAASPAEQEGQKPKLSPSVGTAQEASLSTSQSLKEENSQKVTQENKGSASSAEKESPKPAKLSPSLDTAQKASLDTSQALIRENTQKVMAQLREAVASRNAASPAEKDSPKPVKLSPSVGTAQEASLSTSQPLKEENSQKVTQEKLAAKGSASPAEQEGQKPKLSPSVGTAQEASLSTSQPLKEENSQKVTQEKLAAKGSASPVEKESPKPAKLSPSVGTAQEASLDTSQALIMENYKKVRAQLQEVIARRNAASPAEQESQKPKLSPSVGTAQEASLSTSQPLKEENSQKVTQENKGSASSAEKESPKPAKLSPSLGTAQKASLDTSQALIMENYKKVRAQLLEVIARRNAASPAEQEGQKPKLSPSVGTAQKASLSTSQSSIEENSQKVTRENKGSASPAEQESPKLKFSHSVGTALGFKPVGQFSRVHSPILNRMATTQSKTENISEPAKARSSSESQVTSSGHSGTHVKHISEPTRARSSSESQVPSNRQRKLSVKETARSFEPTGQLPLSRGYSSTLDKIATALSMTGTISGHAESQVTANKQSGLSVKEAAARSLEPTSQLPSRGQSPTFGKMTTAPSMTGNISEPARARSSSDEGKITSNRQTEPSVGNISEPTRGRSFSESQVTGNRQRKLSVKETAFGFEPTGQLPLSRGYSSTLDKIATALSMTGTISGHAESQVTANKQSGLSVKEAAARSLEPTSQLPSRGQSPTFGKMTTAPSMTGNISEPARARSSSDEGKITSNRQTEPSVGNISEPTRGRSFSESQVTGNRQRKLSVKETAFGFEPTGQLPIKTQSYGSTFAKLSEAMKSVSNDVKLERSSSFVSRVTKGAQSTSTAAALSLSQTPDTELSKPTRGMSR